MLKFPIHKILVSSIFVFGMSTAISEEAIVLALNTQASVSASQDSLNAVVTPGIAPSEVTSTLTTSVAIPVIPKVSFETLSASEISNTGRLRISFKLNGVKRGKGGTAIHFTLRDTEGKKLAEMRGHAHASIKQAIEWQALAGTKNSPEGVYLLVAEIADAHRVQRLPLGL